MYRKFISAVLVTALLAGLSACGNDTQPEETTVSGGETTTEAESTSYIDTLPKTDYTGQTFTVIGQSYASRQNFYIEELEGEVRNDALHDRDAGVTERLGITLEYIGIQERGDVTAAVQQAVLAGDEAYNLVMNSLSAGMNTLASGGLLLDLNTLPYLSLDSALWNKSMVENMSFDGKLYFTTGPISLSYYTTPIAMMMNLRLADEYKVENIYDTVKSGKWTVDKLYGYIKDIPRDLNNDGKMDENDFYGLIVDGSFGNVLFNSTGIQSVKDNKLNLDNAQAIDAIDKLSNMFGDRDVVFNDSKGSGVAVPTFKNGNGLFMDYTMLGISKMRDMKDDFAIIPTPKYDESQDSYNTICNTWLPSGVGVPMICSDPERTGLVMETLAYYSNEYLTPAVYEVTLKGKVARDDDSSIMLDMIYRDTYFDMVTAFNFADTGTMLRDAVLGETDNFASSYASIKASAQAELDKILEGANG